MINKYIIDNGSIHLQQLIELVNPKAILSPQDSLDFPDGSFVFLSGSPTKSVIGNQEYYQKELEFISTSPAFIIGICLGCELIGYHYGATLKKLMHREHGSLEIAPTSLGIAWLGADYLRVTEAHHWAITKVPSNIQVLAYSKDGIEAYVVGRRVGLQFHPEATEGGGKILHKILTQLTLNSKNDLKTTEYHP